MECVQETKKRRKKKSPYASHLGWDNHSRGFGYQWSGVAFCPAHPTLLGTSYAWGFYGFPILHAGIWWNRGNRNSEKVHERGECHESWHGVPMPFAGFLCL